MLKNFAGWKKREKSVILSATIMARACRMENAFATLFIQENIVSNLPKYIKCYPKNKKM